ncbi:MAG: hypothetical protein VYC51_02395, partial [Pseudomonadota bacterium]|nr:hypothetical protein [Pseudomonadota bacterium]
VLAVHAAAGAKKTGAALQAPAGAGELHRARARQRRWIKLAVVGAERVAAAGDGDKAAVVLLAATQGGAGVAIVVVVGRHALVLDASAHDAQLLGALVLAVRPNVARKAPAFWRRELGGT